MRKRIGPRTLPCGTPWGSVLLLDSYPLIIRYDRNQFICICVYFKVLFIYLYFQEGDAAIMMSVLDGLRAHEDAWLFMEPVKEEEAPHYYTYIRNPMDFKTVGEKIQANLYGGRDDFEQDMLLIFDNCETYNGTFSPFTRMAFKLKR